MHYLSKKGQIYSLTRPPFWMIYLLVVLSLACVTNTPVAQISTARPTRTAVSTFTNTPIPPTSTPVPTPTNTPIPTNTPPVTDTPIPSDTPTNTPIPPTDTPVPPTNTAAPTPVPPTNTLVPTPTPIPVAISPLSTPTFTPVPPSPHGKYKPTEEEGEANCAHVGVIGTVRTGPDDDDDPIANVTIQVTGEDDFEGPFYGTTGSNGKYTIVIGELRYVGEMEFKAEVFGPDVKTDNKPKWETTDDCHAHDANQVMKIDWMRD